MQHDAKNLVFSRFDDSYSFIWTKVQLNPRILSPLTYPKNGVTIISVASGKEKILKKNSFFLILYLPDPMNKHSFLM